MRPDPSSSLPAPTPRADPRNLKAGRTVADRNGYYDSQNMVVVGGDDGGPFTLVCVFHHSENREGGPGLQLFVTRSSDRGVTWSAPEAVEGPPRQSHDGYQLVHRRRDGSTRIVLLYGWNQGSQYPPGADPALPTLRRTDMQLDEGYWCRVSDNHGVTWGPRHVVPVRRTRIDRENPWGGSTMGMFLCDKPSVIGGAVWAAFQKTRDGAGETAGSEVFFLRSPDLLSVDDPADATWETLPAGDAGLQAPSGLLALGEEPHVLQVGDDPQRLCCLWRTEVGRVAAAYSADGGHSWSGSEWLTMDGRPGGHPVRNPRGAMTPHRFRDAAPDGSAEYALLFYNNGRTERDGYVGRRVAWLTVGRSTADGRIAWHQPEVALWWDGTGFEDRPGWNPDWAIVDGPGYADFAELPDGTLAVVESNKLAVRYHEVEARLLGALRLQPELNGLPADRALDWTRGAPAQSRGPVLPDPAAGGGFSITLALRGVLPADGVLVDARSTVTAALGEEPTDRTVSKGWSVGVSRGELTLTVTDGFDATLRHSTAIASGVLWDGGLHTVTFTVDGGPKIVSVVVDERLDDGGDSPQGWAFFDPRIGEVGGADVDVVHPAVQRLIVTCRPLLTSEAIAAGRALRDPA